MFFFLSLSDVGGCVTNACFYYLSCCFQCFKVGFRHVCQDLRCSISRFYPLPLSLLSLQGMPGMRGMHASGLPVYSEGFLLCHPPPPQFPLKDFSHFLLTVVLGTGHGSLLQHSCICVWFSSAGILSYSTSCIVSFKHT